MPAGGSGDVFTAEPYIAGEDTGEETSVEVILLEVTILSDEADDATDTFGERAPEDEGILFIGSGDFSAG